MIAIGFSIQRKVELKALAPEKQRKLMANAINRTLEEAQRVQRELVARRFIDRQRRGLLERMVKISREDRAQPDRLTGRIRIAGHDLAAEPVAAKQVLAFIPDEPHLFEYLTVEEHLRFVGRLYGVADAPERIPRMLA